jgi:hypothetical protein
MKSADEVVHVVDPTTDERWLRFVERSVDATIFHHPSWLTLLRDQYRFPTLAICVERDEEIVAGIPFCGVDGLVSRRKWVCLPFSDCCGPLAPSSADETRLIDHARKYLEPRSAGVEIRSGLAEGSGFATCSSHWIHVLDLAPERDALLSGLRPNFRSRVRKAERHGLVTDIRQDEGAMDIFYALHLKTRRRQGVPIQPRRYFRLFQKRVIECGLGFISITRKGPEPLSAAIFCGLRNTLVYKYGASDPAGLALFPNYLMFWTTIAYARQRGFSRLDFGKTAFADAGLRTFKVGWNAAESDLPYSYFPRRPSGRAMDLLYRSVVRPVVRHSPPVVCRLAGEVLYRRFAA